MVRERACLSLGAGRRPAAQGVPFLPVAGFQGSDLPEALGWKTVHDPYGGDELYAVPRLQPDWAVVHAPRGAWPGSCFPLYEVDYAAAEAYAGMPDDAASLARHLDETSERDRR